MDSAGGTFGCRCQWCVATGSTWQVGAFWPVVTCQIRSLFRWNQLDQDLVDKQESSACHKVLSRYMPPNWWYVSCSLAKYLTNTTIQVFLLLLKVILGQKIMASRMLRQLSTTDLIQILPTHSSTALPLATTTSFQKSSGLSSDEISLLDLRIFWILV